MISLTCSFIWQKVPGIFSCFDHSYDPKDEKNPKARTSNVDPAHTSKMAMKGLNDRIPEKLISLKSEFIWLPRSPDLNPFDFYIWGYINDEIGGNKSCYD